MRLLPLALFTALPLQAADTPAPQAEEAALPAGLEGLNASEQLVTLHLMAAAHAVDILSQDMPLAQRAAEMQELTERMHKLAAAYRELDAAELAAAERTAIGHASAQRIAVDFMARLQYWAARDFDGSGALKAAVFGFLEAENRQPKEAETAAQD